MTGNQNKKYVVKIFYSSKIFVKIIYIGFMLVFFLVIARPALATRVSCASLNVELNVDPKAPPVLVRKLSDQINIPLFVAAQIRHGNACRLAVAIEVIPVSHLDAPVQVLIHRPLPTNGAGGLRITMTLAAGDTEVWRTVREARGYYGAVALNGILGRAMAPMFDAVDFTGALNPFSGEHYDIVKKNICNIASPNHKIPSIISKKIKTIKYINFDDSFPCMIYCEGLLYKTGINGVIIDPDGGMLDDLILAFGPAGRIFYPIYIAPSLALMTPPPDKIFLLSDVVPGSPYPAHKWTAQSALQADAELGFDETIIAVGPLSSGGAAFIKTSQFRDLHAGTPLELSRDVMIGPGPGRILRCNGSSSSEMTYVIRRIADFNFSIGSSR